MFLLDEFGLFLGMIRDSRNEYRRQLNDILLTMYTSSGGIFKGPAYSDRNQNFFIPYPSPCIYGTTTPGSFWGGLSLGSITEGLLPRLLIAHGRSHLDFRAPDPSLKTAFPDGLLTWGQWWKDFDPRPIHRREGGTNLSWDPIYKHSLTIPFERDAWARWEEHATEIRRRAREESEARRAVWSRTAEKSSKVALLLSCSRMGPEGQGIRPSKISVTLEDMDLAIRVSNFGTRLLIQDSQNQIAENPAHRALLTILQIIRNHSAKRKGGIWREQLQRYSSSKGITGRLFKDCLDELLEMGCVRYEMRDNYVRRKGAKPTTHPFLIWISDLEAV